MYMGILSICMSLYYVHAVTTEARRRCQLPWNWSYKQLRATMQMLGIKPGPLQEQSVLLTAELFLQHHSHFKKIFKSHNNNEKYRDPLFQTKNSIIGCSLWQDCSTLLKTMDVQTS